LAAVAWRVSFPALIAGGRRSPDAVRQGGRQGETLGDVRAASSKPKGAGYECAPWQYTYGSKASREAATAAQSIAAAPTARDRAEAETRAITTRPSSTGALRASVGRRAYPLREKLPLRRLHPGFPTRSSSATGAAQGNLPRLGQATCTSVAQAVRPHLAVNRPSRATIFPPARQTRAQRVET